MASVLEPLKPIVALIRQASEPMVLAQRLIELAASKATGPELVRFISANVTDGDLVHSALVHAAVLDVTGNRMPEATIRLAQTQVLVEAAEDSWELVLTVPGFLRQALTNLVATSGDQSRPRETQPTLLEVATTAQKSLLIAAPYLHADFISTLADPLQRLLRTGGTATVITRAISLAAPERSSANVNAVTLLRQFGERTGRPITVRSWEESGLGVHFKVVIADNKLAYLGSANLTPAGTAAHAEAGVLLRGPRVAYLSGWLTAVADELARRRFPSG
ncbi:phospholipase D-like domain-containing protein [Rhodococcus pyridinivorans]|uniref:phospholipase D-like domain-containing protein n=1 Tax=Rhodococcus pyridinivorans TaxID=103816 RepID=UPI000A889E86|nr:phospholipase D-like domain-containing protein [Rhodococcus pyridinivorans]